MILVDMTDGRRRINTVYATADAVKKCLAKGGREVVIVISLEVEFVR
jgi:hypothetical protein